MNSHYLYQFGWIQKSDIEQKQNKTKTHPKQKTNHRILNSKTGKTKWCTVWGYTWLVKYVQKVQAQSILTEWKEMCTVKDDT